MERKLPSELLEKWKFPSQFRERFRDEAFQGDGSRGGPERREMTPQEREMYTAAMTPSVRTCKI